MKKFKFVLLFLSKIKLKETPKAMKKLSLLVALIFLFSGLTYSQQDKQSQPDNQQKCNIKLDAKYDYRPDFKFITSHPKVFKDDLPQINLYKSKFNTSFNHYKCYKYYFKEYRAKKTAAESYPSRSRRKRELKKAQKDSLVAINYYNAAVRLCMQNYPKYNELLKSRYAVLLAKNQNKLQNQRFKNLVDSMTNLVIKYQEQANKLNVDLNKYKGLKQLDKSIELCKKFKAISNVYLDLILAFIGNANDLNKLYQKYKIKKVVSPNPKPQVIMDISKFLIDIKPENAENFLRLTDQDREKLQNIIATIEKIKKNEVKVNYTNDEFIREAVSTYIAELYYNAYKELFELYYPAIEIKKDLMQKISNDACNLYKLYQQTGDKTYLWQAANVLAYGVNIEEYEISRQFINIDTVYYIPRFKEKCENFLSATGQTYANTNTAKPKTRVRQTPAKHKTVSLCKSLYTYTINQPKPKKINERGTYYRVYVALTKNNLVTTIWKDYLPIYYIPVCNSSLKKFYVGKYKTFDQANRAANEIKAKFKISFVKVVKFVNGRPVKIYNIRKVPAKTQASTPGSTGTIYDITKTKALTYVIRLGTYSSPKKPGDITHLKNLYYEKTPDGKYIYYDGPYYKFSDAAAALEKIKSLGYADAYIRAFHNGKLIDINTARKLENSTATQVRAQYGVQIGSYKHPLTLDEFNKIYGKISTYNIKYTKHLNRYKYYIPAKDYQTAKSILKQVKSKGFDDAFIIKIQTNNISAVK